MVLIQIRGTVLTTQLILLATNRTEYGWAWADLNHEGFASLALWAQTAMAHAPLVTVVPHKSGPGRI